MATPHPSGGAGSLNARRLTHPLRRGRQPSNPIDGFRPADGNRFAMAWPGRVLEISTESLILAQDERWRRA